MKYGICCSPGDSAACAQAGFGFIEVNVQSQLKPRESEDLFLAELRQMKGCPAPCIAANCFIPADLPLTGRKADLGRIAKYVDVALERAHRAGIQTVVFGSGGARKVPDEYDPARAWKQLVDFGLLAANAAARYAITLVAEPLNKSETNILTTIGETARYVKEINHTNMRLLADSYHWARENDSTADLVAAVPYIRHVHVGTYANRKAPSLEPCDFAPFFQALHEGGYDHTVSIEAGWNDLAAEAPAALTLLRSLIEPPPRTSAPAPVDTVTGPTAAEPSPDTDTTTN